MHNILLLMYRKNKHIISLLLVFLFLTPFFLQLEHTFFNNHQQYKVVNHKVFRVQSNFNCGILHKNIYYLFVHPPIYTKVFKFTDNYKQNFHFITKIYFSIELSFLLRAPPFLV